MKKGYTERKNQEIDIYIENQEYIANNYVMKCFSVYMILYTGLFIVNQMSIFTIDKKLMMLAYIPSLIIYFFTCLITKRLSMSHSSMKYIILFCFMSVSTITGVFLTYHVVVAMVLPLLYALLYSSKATMRYIYILTIISTIIIVYGGYYYGLCDANMVLLTEKNLQGYLSEGRFILTKINPNPQFSLFLFFVVPRCFIYLTFIIVLSDLDQSENEREIITENKVKTIQETYLFSMYIDLNNDKASGINVTEISNDDLHYEIKYSEWRNTIVNMIWGEDQETFLENSNPEYLKAKLKPGKNLSFDCQMKNLEGQFIWVRLIFGRIDTTSEHDYRFVFMVQNIHEDSMRLFKELKKFENLASFDPLTEVFNHGRIETELNNAIVELNGCDGQSSLMMLDIDYFKKVNDTYGHAVGDETLKAFIRCVKEAVASYDIRIGRWGGEEFVFVCYGYDSNSIQEIAENIRTSVESRIFDTIGHITCSIGITCIGENDTADSAFKRLDEALYDAKTSGRNCIKVKK